MNLFNSKINTQVKAQTKARSNTRAQLNTTAIYGCALLLSALLSNQTLASQVAANSVKQAPLISSKTTDLAIVCRVEPWNCERIK